MPRSIVPEGWLHERRELYHGIPVVITARKCLATAWEAAWRTLVEADAVCNRFAVDSEISRLAAIPDAEGVRLSPLLATAIRAALRHHRLSEGTSDASVRPLVELWRTAVAAQAWPDPALIAAARTRCRLADLSVDAEGRLHVAGGAWSADLDLGGVVKGVLVDVVAADLRAAGIADFLVQIGGETTVHGRAPGDRPWRIGLQHPLDADTVWLVLVAPPAGLSCSTSADYRRGWTIGAEPVSHLIDPRSGRPASPDLLTAHAVFAASGRCGDAEALTKAIALLPRDRADAAVRAAGGEWLHLEAAENGLIESRSHGFAALIGTS